MIKKSSQYLLQSIFIFSILYLVTFAIIYSSFLFGNQYFIFKDIGSDTINAFLPQSAYITDLKFSGKSPKWSFQFGIGQDVRNIQKTFSLISCIAKDSLINVPIYAHLVFSFLSGLFFLLFLRHIKLSNNIAVLFALIYCFSSFIALGGTWYMYTLQAMRVAFILFLFEHYIKYKKWWLVPIIPLLSSSVVFLFHISLIIAFYSIFRYYFIEHSYTVKEYFRKVLSFGVFAFLGFVLYFPKYLIKLYKILNSPRISGDVNQSTKLFTQSNLLIDTELFYTTWIGRLISGNIAGIGNAYQGWYNYLEAPMNSPGLFSLLLLIPGIFIFKENRKKIFLISFFIVLVLFQVIPVLRYSLWLFQGQYFRLAGFILPLFIIICSALLLEQILRSENRKLNFFITFSGLILVSIIIILSIYFSTPIFLSACLITCSILYVIVLINRNTKYCVMILTMLFLINTVIVERFVINKRITLSVSDIKNERYYNDKSQTIISKLQEEINDETFFRIEKTFGSSYAMHKSLNDALYQGFYGTKSYQSFNNNQYVRFLNGMEVIAPNNESSTRWISGFLTRPILLHQFGVKYIIDNGQLKSNPPGFILRDRLDQFTIYENKTPFPLGRVLYKKCVSNDLSQYKKHQKDVLLLDHVVLAERDYSNSSLAPFLANTSIDPHRFNIDSLQRKYIYTKSTFFKLNQFKEDNIRGSISLFDRGILCFSIPYHRDWKIKVNGTDYNTIRVNFGMLGVELDKGNYNIELEFGNPIIEKLSVISSIFVLFYIIIILSILVISFFKRD